MSVLSFRKPKKKRGRPFLNKEYPNISHMRVSEELLALLTSEKSENETLSETALRLIRSRVKKVEALTQELQVKDKVIETLKLNEKMIEVRTR
jgi:ppGpp synthetase/RelA/SpoT-type nucleotidyltranferase